jgi:ABC-type branched-subunit amino acid transport system substrate-binding protein
VNKYIYKLSNNNMMSCQTVKNWNSQRMSTTERSKQTCVIRVLVALIILQDAHCGLTVINLATFLPRTGQWAVGKTIAPAAQLAADDINNNTNLLPDHVIEISYHDTACEQGKAILEIVRVFTGSKKIHGIIGDGCDVVCEPLGLLAFEFRLPMISWGCSAIALSNKDKYGTFARTVGPRTNTFRAMMGLLHHFKWNRIGILASFSGTWEWLAQAIKTELEVTLPLFMDGF